MQTASREYKESVRQALRQWSHIKVTLGMINQEAQASAHIPHTQNYAYYSNLEKPLDNYDVKELYATCDQDYSTVDGSMYFLPRDGRDIIMNAGAVSLKPFGAIEVRFPKPHDIKGLTIEFGKSYPVDFILESEIGAMEIKGNGDGHFVTDAIFRNATFIRMTPSKMVNGQSRFRMNKITMGTGIYFDGRNTLSATKKEHISPISEELPTIDFELTADNKNRAYDIENEESTLHFLEVGQDVEVIYGYELKPGSIEWIPGAKLFLKEWSADDEEVSFSASDRFDSMAGTYYRGKHRAGGISLYDLAEDVLLDAGVDKREYWIDPYLKTVEIHNPMPAVQHKEALQIVANAGRCILYQNRAGDIIMKSSFMPDMHASSRNETYFSHAGGVIGENEKQPYGLTGNNYTGTGQEERFLPRETPGASFQETGYISEAAADGNGSFADNPVVAITLEASFKCFGISLEFGRNPPKKALVHTYYAGELQEKYAVAELEVITAINHEFPEFDYMEIEFTEGAPHNRVTLNKVLFGDGTDYKLEYGRELTKTPKGTQLQKVREIQVLRTMYHESQEVKELLKETIFAEPGTSYTFYFSNPSYDLLCAITDAQNGEEALITECSSFYATVKIKGVNGTAEVIVSGREYAITQNKVTKELNHVGAVRAWENPLISDVKHAKDMADWIGDYMRSDRDYDLSYRGEPRLDANDIAFLENKYVPGMVVRVYDHTLKFNGALSGTIKARRDMGYVAAAKNRLEGK